MYNLHDLNLLIENWSKKIAKEQFIKKGNNENEVKEVLDIIYNEPVKNNKGELLKNIVNQYSDNFDKLKKEIVPITLKKELDDDFDNLKNNSLVIEDNEDWLVVAPYTYEEARKYGHKTHVKDPKAFINPTWCIIASDGFGYFNNMYSSEYYPNIVFFINKHNMNERYALVLNHEFTEDFDIQGNINEFRDSQQRIYDNFEDAYTEFINSNDSLGDINEKIKNAILKNENKKNYTNTKNNNREFDEKFYAMKPWTKLSFNEIKKYFDYLSETNMSNIIKYYIDNNIITENDLTNIHDKILISILDRLDSNNKSLFFNNDKIFNKVAKILENYNGTDYIWDKIIRRTKNPLEKIIQYYDKIDLASWYDLLDFLDKETVLKLKNKLPMGVILRKIDDDDILIEIIMKRMNKMSNKNWDDIYKNKKILKNEDIYKKIPNITDYINEGTLLKLYYNHKSIRKYIPFNRLPWFSLLYNNELETEEVKRNAEYIVKHVFFNRFNNDYYDIKHINIPYYIDYFKPFIFKYSNKIKEEVWEILIDENLLSKDELKYVPKEILERIKGSSQ